MRRDSAAIVCLVVLGATACNGSSDNGESIASETAAVTSEDVEAPSPSPTTAPVNVRYDSVYDLRELVEEGGTECADWEVLAEPAGATERATCTSSVVLSLYTDAAQVARSIDTTAAITNSVDLVSAHIAGPNWSVTCGEEVQLCRRLRDHVGGELEIRSPDR